MPAVTTTAPGLLKVTRGALDLRMSRDHANAQLKAVQSEARSPPATAPDQTPEQRAEPQALKAQRTLPPLGQAQVPARLRAPRTKAPDSVQRANWDGLMKPRGGNKTATGNQTKKQRSSPSMSPPRNRSSGPVRAKGAVGRQYKPEAGKGVAVVEEGESQGGWGGGEGLKEVASPVVMGPKDLEGLFSPQPSLVRQLIPQDQVIPPELHAELVFERIAGDYSRFFPADVRVVGGKHVGSCSPLSIAGFTLARRRDIDLEQRKRMLGIVRKVLDTGSTQVSTVHA
ncbi:hypothetical protein PHLCEN_2v11566 [Hermanssonia centrifuga]|uniref:Uncharacterized protein n=1 Tax=Hermanssonia centrifuga TaxID=98765 RepID=A0A2R6NJP3_9APHY|nr:hypothetical protein PHLCEN_2v11566 [Hermanssonia centrifuga]